MKRKVVMVLGSAFYIKDYLKFLRKESPQTLLLVIDFLEKKKFVPKKNTVYFSLDSKKTNYLEQIVTFCKNQDYEVQSVLNRLDSLEVLHGKLCDYYGVVGPSSDAVKKLADKSRMHKLMLSSGLAFYRPRTISTSLTTASEYLDQLQFPVVMKGSSGAKSRGVVVLKKKEDFKVYKNLFLQNKIFNNKTKILFEQMVLGKQVTPVMYVNSKGKVQILALVDVITARETGQDHMQLVYRTTPSQHTEAVRQKITFVMQRLVKKAKLKSVMLHPEFFVVGKNIFLIEVNVRIGGFRHNLMKEAYNIDLNRVSWDIAHDDMKLVDDIENDKSCTACEVWENKSGKIIEFKMPKSKHISSIKQSKYIGDIYNMPPIEYKPLATFYITTQENSLQKAKQIRKKFRVSFEDLDS